MQDRPKSSAALPTRCKQGGAASARRRVTLFWRVSGLIWGLLFLAIVIPTALTIRSSGAMLRQKLLDHGTTVAAAVANATVNLVAAEDKNSLQGLILTLIQGDGLIASARICDKAGAVVCQSREEEKDTVVLELATPPAQTVSNEVVRADGVPFLQVSTPLFKFGEPWGTFQFELSLSHLDAELAATAQRSLWTGIALLALGTLAAAWLARTLVRPIHKLAAVAAEVARGNLNARSGLSSADELGDLGRAFDAMTAELSKASNELKARSTTLERQVSRRTEALEAKQKELEEAKKTADAVHRSKNGFLASISQEMRAPLDQIIGMADVALDTHLLPEQRQYITLAKESAQGLRVMLTDLVDYFLRLESGKAVSVPIVFQVRDLVGDTLRLLEVRAREKAVELVGHIAPEIPDGLVGDPDRLRQILLNLVGHSIKLSGGSELVLQVAKRELTEKEACLCFTAVRAGSGVPRDEAEAICAALSCGRGGEPRENCLGLAVSAQLAEAMGGRITFESSEARGSAFHLEMTFQIRREESDSEGGASAPSFEGASALVVAASPALRSAILDMLAGWGLNAQAADGSGALPLLKKAAESGRPTDLLLLDGSTSEAERLALFKAVEARPGLVRAVVLIGAPSGGDEEVASWSRVASVSSIEKPVKESEVLQTVREIAGLRPAAAGS